MFGSLQEFIPSCFSQQFAPDPDSQQPKTHNRSSIGKQRKKETAAEVSQLRQNHQIRANRINFAEETKTKREKGRRTSQQSQESVLKRDGTTFSRSLPAKKCENNYKTIEYVAEDKSFLLSHYKKLKKRFDCLPKQQIEMARIKKNEVLQQPTEKAAPSYLHLKGKLKQNHHLLRSLLQVEELEQANPKSFFQISFESMCQQLQQIKINRQLRNSNHFGEEEKVKKTSLEQESKNKEKIESQNKLADIFQKNNDSASPRKTIRLSTQKKWIETRSRSLQGSEQRKRISSLQIHQNQCRRKTVMKRIERLVNRSPRSYRKNSRGSSLRATIRGTSKSIF